MAWIESHQSLLTHRKTLRAASWLKVSKPLLIGHLHVLWWWAIDNVDNDGNLNDTSDDEIADAAGWPRKAVTFVEALTVSGFICRHTDCDTKTGSNGRRLHSWYDYVGKLNRRRDEAKVRMQRARAANVRSTWPERSGPPTNQPTNQHNQHNQPARAGAGAVSLAAVLSREYQSLAGAISPTLAAVFGELEDEPGFDPTPECIEHSFKAAAVAGARNWNYVEAVIRRHLKEGCYAGKPGQNSGRMDPAGATVGFDSTLYFPDP